MNTLSRLGIALAFALALTLLTTPARAEDKNGLSVLVTKTTLDKTGSRTNYSSYERTNKTQALKVTVKNISFKAMPEGEMTWKILVVGSSSSSLYTGVEKVNALKPAETQELIIGATQVTAWKSYSGHGGDKTEHQITVNQGDKEIIKIQTTPGFDGMAKRASSASSGTSTTGTSEKTGSN